MGVDTTEINEFLSKMSSEVPRQKERNHQIVFSSQLATSLKINITLKSLDKLLISVLSDNSISVAPFTLHSVEHSWLG